MLTENNCLLQRPLSHSSLLSNFTGKVCKWKTVLVYKQMQWPYICRYTFYTK